MNQTNGQMDHDKQTPTSSLEITGKSLKSNKITDGENGAEVKEKCQRTMEKWLNRTLRIELIDGRVIVGKFVCTDRHPNIILVNSYEFWLISEREFRAKEEAKAEKETIEEGIHIPPMRNVGMVMIKREHVERIYLLNPQQQEQEMKEEVKI